MKRLLAAVALALVAGSAIVSESQESSETSADVVPWIVAESGDGAGSATTTVISGRAAKPPSTAPLTTTTTPTTTTPTTTTPTTTTVAAERPYPSLVSNFERSAWLTVNRDTAGNLIIPKNSPESSGNFRMFCGFVKVGYDDPIVYPGQANVGHLHQFFGNDAITGSSTYQSLRTTGSTALLANPTSCQGGPLNRTGYWAPALFDSTNQVLVPDTYSVYYKGNGTRSDIEAIETMPNGLRMIAGFDMASTDVSMPYGAMAPNWMCLNGSNWVTKRTLAAFTSTTCPAGSEIKAELRFPQCWDGKHLDSANHRSHMSYALGGGGWFTAQPGGKCPTSHPVHLPEFTLFVHYRSDGDVANWYLSSDRMPGMTHANGETFHADWFGAWDNVVQDTWVQECIRELRDCNFGELGDGTSLKNWSGTYAGPAHIAGYTPTPP